MAHSFLSLVPILRLRALVISLRTFSLLHLREFVDNVSAHNHPPFSTMNQLILSWRHLGDIDLPCDTLDFLKVSKSRLLNICTKTVNRDEVVCVVFAKNIADTVDCLLVQVQTVWTQMMQTDLVLGVDVAGCEIYASYDGNIQVGFQKLKKFSLIFCDG